MREFSSVRTVEDHRTLDESDVLIGYMEGFEGRPLPFGSHSRSFFHGWRNGMVDAGLAEPDDDQAVLAAAFEALGPATVLH